MNVRGTGLIGLYIIATNNFVLVGNEVPDSWDKTIEEVFKVPIIRLTIAGTSLLGAFIATNGEEIIVPSIIFSREEKILENAGVKYTKITTDLTCLGNNVVATEKGTLLNPEFDDLAIKQIEQAFPGKAKKITIGENPTVGSFIVHNNKFGLISPDVSDENAKIIEEHLGIKLSSGTVEMGVTQVRSGLVANKNGYLIGNHSGGPELVNADRALGYSE